MTKSKTAPAASATSDHDKTLQRQRARAAKKLLKRRRIKSGHASKR